MPIKSLKHFSLTMIVSAAAFLFVSSFAYPQKTNPFQKFSGNWTGNGLIYLSSGSQEKIRCRSTFNHGDSFNVVNMKMDVRCAGDSYKFELGADVKYNNGAISGVWTETSRGVNGNISGTATDDKINGVIESPTFTATFQLTNLGDKQQIVIASPGSEMTDVLIGLNRAK